MAITDKCSEKRLLSVISHYNVQKFTDKSLENVGLSVKCGLITDKSAKIGSLSVNFSEILADCPKNKKYPTIIRLLCLTIIGHFNHGTDFYNYSVAYGLMSARFRTLLIGFRLTTPLSQAPLLKNYSHSKPYSCEGCLDCGLLNIRSSCRSTAKQAVQVQESGCLLRLQDI